MKNLLVFGGVLLVFGTCAQCYELQWVHVKMETDKMPENAVRIGRDSNGKIYLGRANFSGDLLPADVIPEKKFCYVTFEGVATKLKECEVLSYDKSTEKKLSWVKAQNGAVPPNAIKIGFAQNHRNDHEVLYAGRVNYEDLTIPGKIHPSHKVCYYPIGDNEKYSATYECLVQE